MYHEIIIEDITPNLTEEDCEFVRRLAVKRLKILFDNSFISFSCAKEETLQGLQEFLEAKKCQYKFGLRQTIYERGELQGFDFFYCDGQPIPNATLEYFDFRADYNEGFDMTGYCPKCGCGAVQTGPVSTRGCHKGIFRGKRLLTPFWTEWFADDELAERLRQADLTGLEILPVYNKKMKELPYIHQLKPANIVKDLFVPGIYRYGDKCPSCENYKNVICLNELNVKINDICIRKERAPLLMDFNETREQNMRHTGYYIISRKFLNVMLEAGVRQGKDVCFFPVRIQ